MISRQTIESVRDIPVEEVLKKYGLTLVEQGKYVKCCCPLHGEKTPSLIVNTHKNTWHCFGCHEGGSAINFVMQHESKTFPEAVKAIAESCGIEVKYEGVERSEEQKEAELERDSMRIAVKVIQDFFVEQFHGKSQDAINARKYAHNRWDPIFCDETGIGYAPKDSNLLIEYLNQKSINLDIVEKLGYIRQSDKTGKWYCTFFDRITIPIRDRLSRVIAFTARRMSEDDKYPKYKNSSTSPIYSKSDTLFGIDAAIPQARKSSYFIIVEGAPDVLRLQSIGLTQAVAPLGTALTSKQLDQLRRIQTAIRFIPDSDKPKDGDLYGPGVKSVMKSGVLAMEKGFDVSVREIPRTKEDDENGIKHDADSYITSKDVYTKLDDVPFVVWYARKRFAGADAQNLQMDVVNEVAGLLILIQDELTREMCIDLLGKIYGKTKLWRDAMRRAGKKIRENSISPDDNDDFSIREKETLRSLGIIPRDGCYQSPDKDGNLVRWSNFIFRPIIQIRDENHSTRILKVINQNGEEAIIDFADSDIDTMRNFRRKLYSKGNFLWRCDDSSSLTAILEYIFSITNIADRVEIMGWNDDEKIYAFANGIFVDGAFHKCDQLGVVEHGTRRYFIPALSELYKNEKTSFQAERRFVANPHGGISLYDFAELLANVYGNGAKIGLLWAIATIFRDVVFKELRFFPMFNIFGVKGSGKTELARCITSIFYAMQQTPSSCSLTSIPAIAYNLSHISNAIVMLDEYSNDLPPERVEIFKNFYGGTSTAKMNMEIKMPVETPVNASVCFMGQYKPEEVAIFTRCLHVQYSKTVFSEEESEKWNELTSIASKGNSHILLELLKHRSIVVNGFSEAYGLTIKDINAQLRGIQMESRIMKCWAAPLAVFRILEPHIDLPFSYAEIFQIFIDGMRHQNEQITKNSDTGEFWHFLESLHQSGKAREGCHFKIRSLKKFRPVATKNPSVRDFVEPKKVLYLNFPAVRLLFNNNYSKTRSGGNTMNAATLESYLKTMSQYLGLGQLRFKTTKANGEIDYEIVTENGLSKRVYSTTSPRALCFDYDALKDLLDINLETETMSEGEMWMDETEDEDQKNKSEEQTISFD